MPGMFGFFGEFNEIIESNPMLETIDPLSLGNNKIINIDKGLLAVSSLKSDPLSPYSNYENENYIACFCGDLIDSKKIHWNSIINIFEKDKFQHFSEYRGNFSFVFFNKINKRLSLVSDRISLQPIFYFISNNSFVYSTALSTFCKLGSLPEFNIGWLHEFLFFNHSIGQTTFFKKVFRLPPATILEYDPNDNKLSLIEYAMPFKGSNNLIKGKKAFEFSLSVFNETAPKYFADNSEIAVSLSGGLDSRTILSMAPPQAMKSLKTYTYGVPNCNDLLVASQITSTLRLPHIKIHFDEEFINKLQDLIYQTVYLSNGLEKINRSTLPYVYQMLTNGGKRFPVIITGISGDHLFRDHIMGYGNVPFLISPGMMQIFRKGRLKINKDIFKTAYGDNFNNFLQHIDKVVKNLQRKYGKLNDPESYLSYLIYETLPKHFGGEAAIANNFSKLRSPYWDPDIIKLAYKIEYSTLGFSKILEKKDKYRECVLQAYLISNNRDLSASPFRGIPLKAFSINNKFVYNAIRILKRGPKRLASFISPSSYSPLEDWRHWFLLLDEIINNLITKNSLLSNYLTLEFLEQVKNEKNIYWQGKILTAEIILNLIKNRWRI